MDSSSKQYPSFSPEYARGSFNGCQLNKVVENHKAKNISPAAQICLASVPGANVPQRA